MAIGTPHVGSWSATEVRRALGAPSLNADIAERYPEPGANFFNLDPWEVAAGNGAFLLAYLNGKPVGCGAVRRLGDGEAEIKRMYVVPGFRGHGIGKALLANLETEARKIGISRLLLGTGDRLPGALALYNHAGYEVIPCFGEYADDPYVICMAKKLR